MYCRNINFHGFKIRDFTSKSCFVGITSWFLYIHRCQFDDKRHTICAILKGAGLRGYVYVFFLFRKHDANMWNTDTSVTVLFEKILLFLNWKGRFTLVCNEHSLYLCMFFFKCCKCKLIHVVLKWNVKHWWETVPPISRTHELWVTEADINHNLRN